MAHEMPRIFILYSGPQGKPVERLTDALSQYAFVVDSGTGFASPQIYDAVIAVSTANAWPVSSFRDAARAAYSANKLMLVRFTKMATSKPHPYTQIVENSLANWKGDEDTDWQALLKRLGLLTNRRGLEQLARIRANSDSQQHVQLKEWADAHIDDPISERVIAQLIGPSFVPTAEQRRSIIRIVLLGAFAVSIIGFAWQSYRVHQIGYNDAAQKTWNRVDKRDVDAMRQYYKIYKRSDQAQLAGFLIKEKEAEFWAQTQELRTIEAYDTYLERFSEELTPPPQFVDLALQERNALIAEREAAFDKLQISLRAMGLLSGQDATDRATPALLAALESYKLEDISAEFVDDWDVVELPDVEALAARIKVFGRRQMLQYKSQRWANLNTDALQTIPESFSQFKRQGGFAGTNNATIYFEDNSYIISPDSLILLWELAGAGEFVDIIVTGHDDGNRPRLASFRLAEKRAANVKNALVNFGVRDALISAKSWGASRPILAGDPDNPQQINRRVEVTFLVR